MNKAYRLNKTAIYALLLSIGLGVGMPSMTFGQENPFELAPRLERPATIDSITADTPTSGNPFELIRKAPSPGEVRVAPAPAEPGPVRTGDPNRYRRLKLAAIFGILLLLAVFLTQMRALFKKSFQAFLNDTVMNQLYRDQQGRGISPFLLLYVMFFINAGVFIFFIIKYYELPQSVGDWSLLLFCMGGVTGLLLLKHLLLGYLSFTFPVEKEVSRYHFMIIIFSIVIGIFLVPVNTLMAYAAESMKSGVLYGSLGIIALIYLFRYLRSLTIADKFFQFHKFHFLLYICTVEIAPVLLLFKLITKQL